MVLPVKTKTTTKKLWFRKLTVSALILCLGVFFNLFTIQTALAAPAITSISKSGGHTDGGQSLTINGSGFIRDKYYQQIQVSNSSGSAMTNVQLDVVLDLASPLGNGHMAASCSDLHFQTTTGTELYYWIETDASNCSSTSQHVWIKVPSLPTGTSYINMLYGSGLSYTSYNNAYQVFDENTVIGNGGFFDDFATAVPSGSALSRWRINDGSWPLGTLATANNYISAGLFRINSVSWGATMAYKTSGTPGLFSFDRTTTMGYIAKMRFYGATSLGDYTGGLIYHQPISGNQDYNLNSHQGYYDATAGWEKTLNSSGTDYPALGSCTVPCPAISTYYKNTFTVNNTTNNNVVATIYRDTTNSPISTYTCTSTNCPTQDLKDFGFDNWASGTSGRWMYVDWYLVAKKPYNVTTTVVGESPTMAVTFGGTNATSFNVTSTSAMSVVTPAHAAGLVNVIITNYLDGTNSGTNNIYTYYSSITISGVSNYGIPVNGGMTFSVTGSTFYAGVPYSIWIGTTQFNSCSASYTNSSTITCASSPIIFDGTGLHDVKVYDDTSHVSNLLNDVVYAYAAPTIASTSNSPRPVIPYFGGTGGGTELVITGTNFYSPATITFIDSALVPIDTCDIATVASTTTIGCDDADGGVPAISEQVVGIMVTTPSGTATIENSFYYTNYTLPTPSTTIPCCNIGITRVIGNSSNLTSAATATPSSLLHSSFPPPLPYSTAFYTRYYPGGGGQAATPSYTKYSSYSGSGGIGITNGPSYTEYLSAWIDYNKDGDFADAGEQIMSNVSTAASATSYASFTVPGTASTGTTRLRVCGAYSTPYCNSSGSGATNDSYVEYEDYDITIAGVSAPTVTGISPTKGRSTASAGASVTITGTGFQTGAIPYFGNPTNNVPFTNITVVNSTTITATVPLNLTSGTAATIYVKNTDGQQNASGPTFTPYGDPTITRVLPYSGVPGGGTAIVITGTNFYDNELVTASANLSGYTCNRVSMTTSSFSCNTTSKTVSNEYVGDSPQRVNIITPSESTFLAPAFLYTSYPQITYSISQYDIGFTNISLTGESGTAINQSSGTATTLTPSSIPTILPNSNDVNQKPYYSNYAISQSGSGIPDLKRYNNYDLYATRGTTYGIYASLYIDLNRDYDFADAGELLVSNQRITAVPPATGALNFSIPYSASLGQTRMRVCSSYYADCPTTGTGSLTYGEVEDYLINITAAAAPTVTSILPTGGPATGLNAVTIYGTGFQTGASAGFSGIAATDEIVQNSTTITATTPSLTAGTYSVSVSNTDSQIGSLSNAYTTFNAPTISTLSRYNGPVSTPITITGTNFYSPISVTNCSGATVVTSTSLTCTTPATPGVYSLEITTDSGSSSDLIYKAYAAPIISSIVPDNGPPSGGNEIIITGTNFYDGAGVTYAVIGGTSCARVIPGTTFLDPGVSGATLKCQTPSKTAGTYAVVVWSDSGSANSSYTYYNAPTITSVIPSSGPASTITPITVNGTNIYEYAPADGYTGVNIGGSTCSRTGISESTAFYCNTPSLTAGSKTLTLFTPSGTTNSSYTYYDVPTVTSTYPWTISTTGGETITINGTNFYSNSYYPISVTLGGISCGSINIISPTQLTCTTPATTAGALNVVVNTGSGSGLKTSWLTSVAPPTISGISPNKGPLGGSQYVTVSGTGFYYNGVSQPTITIGGSNCTSVTVQSETTATCYTPTGTLGAKNVIYYNQKGESATLTNGYTYVNAPTISTVSPNTGSTGGQPGIVITGTNFTDATLVQFGGAGASFTVDNSTQITATAPAHSAGTFDVTVTTPGGTATKSSGFTYVTPTVTSVSPNYGSTAGGTSVTINGTYLTNAYAATFDGYYCTGFTVTNSTTATCTTPAHAAGAVNVVVYNSFDSGTLTNGYTYYAPVVSYVSSSTLDGFYKAGQTINVRVVFNEPVTVTGAPRILLETGSTDRYATYTGAVGAYIDFTYTIVAGDSSSDLEYASTGAIDLNGGTIKDDASSANAVLTLPALYSANSLGGIRQIIVDTTAPVISSLSDNGASDVKSGDVVTITFNVVETLSGISGNPTVTITQSNDTLIGTATYSTRTGSGTSGSPYVYTYTYTVPAGDYANTKVKVNTSDNATNSATQAILSPAFNIDNTAPTNPVFVSITPTSPSSDALPEIKGTSSADTVTVTLYSNSGCSTQIGTGTKATFEGTGITATVTANATTTIYAKAFDAANNGSACTSMTSYVHDNVAPSVTINQKAGQTDPANIGPILFTVVFSESTTNFATGDVSLSGTAGATTATVSGSGTTYEVSVTGMTVSGTVIADILAGRATDAAGNSNTASTSTDKTVTYDITIPSGTINTITTPRNTALGTISGTSADNVGVASVYVVIREGNTCDAPSRDWNGTAWTSPCTASLTPTGTTSWSVSNTPSLGDMVSGKTYNVYLLVNDTAGNNNNWNVSQSVYFDTTAPVISAVSDNGATDVKSGDIVSITFNLVEEGSGQTTNPTVTITQSTDTTIGTATYSNRTGSGTSGDPYVYTYTYTVPAGNYASTKVKVNATDNVGNAATQAVLSPAFNIDNTAPTNPVFVSTTPASPSSNAFPVVKGTSSADTVTVNLYNSSGCTGQIGTGSKATFEGTGITVTATENATTTIYAKAFDLAGNGSTCTSMTSYLHDDTAPVISSLSDNGAADKKSGDVVSITFNLVEEGSGLPANPTVTVTQSNDTLIGSATYSTRTGSGTSGSPYVYTYTYTVPAGNYANTKVKVSATDNAGNAATQAVLSPAFNIDNTAPTAAPTCTPSSGYFAATTGLITCTFGAGGTVVRYTTGGGDPNPSSTIWSNQAFTSTTTLKVISCDDANNCYLTYNTYVYTQDSTPPSTPTITYIDGTTDLLTQTVSFSSTDAQTGISSYNLYYRSATLTGSTCGSYSGWSAPINIVFPDASYDHAMSNYTCYQYYVTAYNGVNLSASSTTSPTAVTKVSKPAPTVSTITPNNGPSGDASYSVIINGANFDPSALVYIDNTLANNITWITSESITANTPSHVAGGPLNIDVKVVNSDAQEGLLEDAYTFWDDPTISSLSATTGPVSNMIIITGTNFYDGGSFDAYSNNCERLALLSDTTMECTTPATAGTVAISVTTPSGTTSSINYTGYYAPTITNVSPSGGPIAGGTTVTLTGTDFVNDANDSLTFAGSPISFTVVSPTQITFTTPAHAAGAVDVLYSNPGGSAESLGGFTYYNIPTITSVTPSVGPVAGGTSVNIVGTNFVNDAYDSLTFGGTAATTFTVNSPTSITATVPAHAVGAVNVVYTNPGGSGTKASGFTYYSLPTITSVTPNGGPVAGGTSVTIIGTNFINDTYDSLTFGGTAASSFTVDSATQITATTPAKAAGSYDVVYTNPGGSGTKSSGFTYYNAPTVSTVSPSVGPVAGGTSVVLTGTNFTGTTSITFGGTTSGTYNVDSPTQITVTTPAKAAGTYDVSVTNPGGTGTKTSGFTYYNIPTITSVTPDVGSITGGTSVAIVGTNFVNDANDTLTFGGTAATAFTVNSPTSITATVPAHAAGAVDVVYINPGGSGTKSSGFTYYNIPTISNISPNGGPVAGGTSVTITGTDFVYVGGSTTLTFGGTAATTFTVNSPTQITATTPAHTAGAVDVVFTNPGGFAESLGGFTYYNIPTITSVTPSVGPIAGGTSVTIIGTNFVDDANDSLTFGGTAASSFTVNSPTQITATTPAHAVGTVNVVYTNPGGSGTKASGFTYYTTPTITSVTPNVGPVAGGTSVTIIGTNFVNDTYDSLTFGGTAASSFTVDSATQITATVPAHTAGAVDVVYTNPGGSGTKTGGFTYYNIPTISTVTPYAGPTTGNTSITITGTNFLGTTAVTIGGTTPGSIVVFNDTTITASTPAKAAGEYNVAVTTPGGTATKTNGFRYWAAPTITSISPDKGPTTGGTYVTIQGSNFFYDGVTGTTISIGGAACTDINLISDTQITCSTPAGTEGAAKDVVVTTPGGAFATLSSSYTYFGNPTITNINPNKGPSVGGQLITITGTNFYDGEIDASVGIGSILAAAPCTIQSIVPTQITCTTTEVLPGEAGLPQDVIVTTATNAVTYNDGYTYYDAPTITSIVPNSGPAGLANAITINGANFYEITGSPLTVTVGGVGQNCTGINIVSSAQITCTTPAGSAGAKTVEVTTPSSPAATSTYTFYGDPTLSYVMNYYGPTAGGNTITIYGTNFYTTTQYPLKVNIDGTPYTAGISAVTPTSFSFTLPASVPPLNSQNEKIVGLSVTTGNTHTSNSLANAYYYSTATLPTVLTPANTRGISNVTLTGISGTGQYIDNSTDTPTDLIHAAGTNPPYLPPSFPYVTAYYSNFGPNQITNSYPGTLGIPRLEKLGRYDISISQPSSAPLTVSVWIDSNRNNNFADDGGALINNQTIPAFGTYTGQLNIPVGAQTSTAPLYTRMRIGTNDANLNASGNGPSNVGEYEDYLVNIQPASAPTVTSIDPNKGPTASGYNVTISGSGFKPGATVYFGVPPLNPATNVIWIDENTITANTPALSSGSTYPVYVKNLDNQQAFLAAAYTAYGAPTISNLGNTYFGVPAGGNTISIFGTNFYYNSLTDIIARIDGIACALTSFISTTEVQCTGVPASTGGEQIVDVQVETPSDTTTLVNAYGYNNYQLPLVSNTSGSIGLSRTELQGEPSYDLFIDNTSNITGALSHSSTPPSLPYTTAYYTDYSPVQTRAGFDLNLGVPRIIRNHTYSMTLTGGGTSLQNYKVWMDRNHDLDFNEADEMIVATGGCTQIPVSGSCTFDIVPPANSILGETRLRVGTDTASVPDNGNGPNSFGEYEDYAVEVLGQPTPVVTNIEPAVGPASPLTTDVTITGSNFDSGAKVKFDTTLATSIVVVNDTTITATTPALALGTYDVTVEQADGTSGTLNGGFIVLPAPTVTSIDPDQVGALTTDQATVTGTNFYDNSQYPVSVSIGGQPCSNPVLTSSTTLTCDYPALAAGTYNVSVTTGSGTGTGNNLITYYGAPTITGVDPSFGSSVGGDIVTITGTNFFPEGGSPSVTFGGEPATAVTVVDENTITATTPAHAVGVVDVIVTIGAETGTLVGGFEYWPHPVNADTSTLDSYSSKIEPVSTTYYNDANTSAVNAGLVKVTLYEQDYGTPAEGRTVTLSALPDTDIMIDGVDCTDFHFLGTSTALSDSLGTACFAVTSSAAFSTESSTTTLSATVTNGNFNLDVTLTDTAELTIGDYSGSSILNYRFRNDDGTELTATPIANTNVPFYNAIVDTIFRLRYGLTRNIYQAGDDLLLDEFSPTASKSFGPTVGFPPASFKAFAGGYAINESTNNMYVITPNEDVTKARVYKFNLNDLSQDPTSFEFPPTVDDNRPYADRVDAPITSTTHNVTKTFIDPDNNLMYFVLTPYYIDDVIETIRIYKVNLATQSVVDVLAAEMPDASHQGYSYDAEIDLANGFMYVTMGGEIGALDNNPPRVMKIKLNGATQAMTKVGTLILDNNSDNITSSLIDLTNQYLYVTTGMPQKIVKIDLNVSATLPPVKVDEITLVPTPADSPNETVGYQSAVIDTVNGYAYFGSSTDYSATDFDGTQRAFITKVDIDPTRTFEVISRLNLLPQNIYADSYYNANYIYFPNTLGAMTNVFPAASIDTLNGYAFFPMTRFNEPRSQGYQKLMRIHLSDFTRKSVNDDLLITNSSTNVLKGSIFRASTGRGYLIKPSGNGNETLVEFNSTNRQNLRLQVAKNVNDQYCNYESINSYVWNDLPNADFVFADSTYFADGAATSNVTGLLYDNNDFFVAGQLKDSNATTSRISLGKNQFSEIEYALKPTSSASGSYCFRLTDADPLHDNQVSGNPNHIYSLTGEDYDPVTFNTFVPVTINGVVLSKNAINVIEATTTDSYGVKLASQPSADVTISINANDSRVILSPDSTPLTPGETSLTFTSGDWDTYQYITVSSDNNGTIDGTTTDLIRHTVTSADADYNNIIAEPVESVITDYGSSSANVLATVSGDVSFTPPTDFAFPDVNIGTTQPNFSPTLTVSFDESRGTATDYVLTVQATDFCKEPGTCIPLNRVYTAAANLINTFNTFTPAEIGQFISNYLQTGEVLTDRATYVHTNPSEDRPLSAPITLIDTRNVPSGNSLNSLQGILTFNLHLMIDYGNLGVQVTPGLYSTTLVFDFNSNP